MLHFPCSVYIYIYYIVLYYITLHYINIIFIFIFILCYIILYYNLQGIQRHQKMGTGDLQVCKDSWNGMMLTIALTALRRRKHAGANMLILVELASPVEEPTFDAYICCTWIVDFSS